MSFIFFGALLLGFYMAWNIGANDVANAMGTSVGSRALTLKKAVLIAAVLEFSGAFFAGSSVSETLQHGIIAPAIFEGNLEIFALGMMGSLFATGALLHIASYFGLPISTTHAVVGAVIGFGSVVGGVEAIHWTQVGWISAAWVISPILSGFIAHLFFRLTQRVVSWIKVPVASEGISTPSPFHQFFISLQIGTACMVAFAHGANDVANAIGPVAAILNVLKTHSLHAKSEIPSWLLALGGCGIVLGLATWGWRVIETVGKKITKLSPMHGFCAEFGAAITILAASKFGLPISTTHALVGAVFGVGLVQGFSSLNLQTLKEIVLSWVITIPSCALLSILAFYLLRFFIGLIQ